jgi:hypothetical protein
MTSQAEADEEILTFDIPDAVLERAGTAEQTAFSDSEARRCSRVGKPLKIIDSPKLERSSSVASQVVTFCNPFGSASPLTDRGKHAKLPELMRR